MAVRNLSVRVGSFGFQWPNASNTGYSGSLTTYTGPGGYDHDTIILDSMFIDSIDIRALGTAQIFLTNCLVNAHLDCDSDTASITAINCEINAGSYEGPAVGFRNITLQNCNIHGGETSVNMSVNGVMDFCYLHDQFLIPDIGEHLGGFLCSGGSNIRVSNTLISAQTPDDGTGGGESGGVQLFGDFDHLSDIQFDHCYFDWTTGGYATSLGYNPGKPFGSDPTLIVVKNSLFGRGPNGKGGVFGTVTSFLDTDPANQFTNNTWADDGTPVIANT